MAIEYILRELGVNYKACLASLSLIGIAVGFGSQGLVQDVVTGVFILLEGQYSVGDVVEIAGQVGMVEEVGLRTTWIRNYLGELVIFPNRGVAVAGKFLKGAIEACVDVAIASEEVADLAGTTLFPGRGGAGRAV
jgi:small conductance mechanosensitive channel